ncbi:hypothetical protein K32_23700 [Kaistia sp. 32K]|uniref:hypothetical protein n=1 Tax=Kaistia sp. 32K TaxID=2795690 RepID=UPI0019168FE7|nr:hypothetical protein [Kaistia sp. 32K]BCP53753.1 hypothetical protein K32_23700 [Kaistia sp. 32K]
MKQFVFASLLVAAMASPAFAEEATTPAVAGDKTNPAAPVAGKNSFTEGQARDRIAAAGYSDVSALVQDADGIWRGKASKGGTVMNVAVDFQGNVTSK